MKKTFVPGTANKSTVMVVDFKIFSLNCHGWAGRKDEKVTVLADLAGYYKARYLK